MQISKRRPGTLTGLMLVITAVSFISTPAFAQQQRRPVGVGVTVFVNPNFSGQSASFRDDTPTLVPYGLNDKISSIQIPQGEIWEVCQDINYANRCQTLTASVANLSSIGWNDTISSLRRVRGGYQGANQGANQGGYQGGYQGGGVLQQNVPLALIVFDRPGFRGTSRTLTSQATNLNYRAGSVQLRGGGSWEVCDRARHCANVTQNVTDLSQLGLTGSIATVRPLNDQYGQNGRRDGRNRDQNYGR